MLHSCAAPQTNTESMHSYRIIFPLPSQKERRKEKQVQESRRKY